jgi:glutamate racemase
MTAPTNELKPVLVFDSGIGGLTVLREARVLMPERGFIYVADDAGFPYGGWEEQALKERVIASLRQDCSRSTIPKSASSPATRRSPSSAPICVLRFPSMTFVGTVPAIKPAAERTRSGLVSVLATPGTVKRAYTRDLIQSFAQQCHVRLVGSENLARMAEAYIQGRCRFRRGGTLRDRAMLSSSRMAARPISWCWPARTIRSWPISSAVSHRGRSIGSIRPKPLRGEPAASCPRVADAVHPDNFDFAVLPLATPTFPTKRLMQGFGLTTR